MLDIRRIADAIMKTILRWIVEIIGGALAKMIPAIGTEIRKNKVVKQTGADDETLDTLDNDIWDAANSDRVQQHIHPEDHSAS